MNKIFYSLAFLTFIGHSAMAQVKFQLNYDSDQERYTVVVVPEATYADPQNITGTGQVTLKVPTGEFDPVDIISYQPGMVWEANSLSEAPIESPEHDYHSFGMIASGLVKPDYRASEEMPLFSFKNKYGCTGTVALMDNVMDEFLPPNSKNANVGNQYTILGAGHAYAGNVNTSGINCALSGNNNTGNGNLTPADFVVYPNPAVSKITVEFDWKNGDEKVEVGIYTIDGKLLDKRTQQIVKGFNKLKFSLNGLPKGTYFLKFESKTGQHRTKEFLKIVA